MISFSVEMQKSSGAAWRLLLKLPAAMVSEIFQKDHFVTVKSAAHGSVHAICSPLDVVDDVMSVDHVQYRPFLGLRLFEFVGC